MLWSYVLNYMTASSAAMSGYALPLVSTLMGYLMLDEVPSIISLFGGALALLGALIAQLDIVRISRLRRQGKSH